MKKCWINEYSSGIYTVSLESDGAKDHERMYIHDTKFPDRDTKEERHVINIGLFDLDDLQYLTNIITNFVKSELWRKP